MRLNAHMLMTVVIPLCPDIYEHFQFDVNIPMLLIYPDRVISDQANEARQLAPRGPGGGGGSQKGKNAPRIKQSLLQSMETK